MYYILNRSKLLILILGLLLTLGCRKIHKSAANTYPECEKFAFDLTDGTINGVKSNLLQDEIKQWFPCYSRIVPNGSDKDCGGGVFYDPYYFSFYTHYYKYMEVRKGFNGVVTDSLFLKNRLEVRKNISSLTDSVNFISADSIDLFPASYGCIRIHYSKSLDGVEKEFPIIIAIHPIDCPNVEWCREDK